MGNRLIFGVIGFVIGLFVYSTFFVGEVGTKTITKHVTDTTYHHYKEKYRIDSIKSISLNDSIGYYKNKYFTKLKEKNITIIQEPTEENESFSAPLRRFSGQQPFLYGNIFFSGIVAGEVLSIDVTGNFKIPTVTNTITTNTTKKIAPKGLYLGADLNNLLVPSPSAYYLDDKWLFKYSYIPSTKDHSVGVAFRVF